MVKQPAKRYDPKKLTEDIERWWKEKNAYSETKRYREKGEDYYFVDGPPYTSGSIHLGTAWNKILKDMGIRYLRMHGYNVRDQPGYDMHGLPIEVLVEKTLGIKNKREIETQGVAKFVNKCKEFAIKNRDNMTSQFKKLGVWMDWENPYMTIEKHYINSAWWTLKQAYEKGLIFRDQRVLSWCPRCETALAEAEIEYKDVEDPSIYVKFPLLRDPKEFLIIWTTTPWTLTGNLAAAVHPEYEYVRVLVERDGKEEIYILLAETHREVLKTAGIEDFVVIETLPGIGLSGLPYRTPLADEVKFPEDGDAQEWMHKVVLFDGVEADKSGIVHIAPGYGPEDFEIGKEYNLPPFCPVSDDGRLGKETGKYAGMYVKDANQRVIDDVENMGLMLHAGTEVHRYGHCWRCKTPIIYRVTNQWFLKVTSVKDRMLEEVDRIKWTPEWMGSSRQRKWVENSRDWCISRQRYWGIPLPIWECECGNIKVVGGEDELAGEAGYTEGMDLHRPWVDDVHPTCPECGKMMQRVPDVLDVWFDSAVCSWAALKYPMEEEEFKKWWPARWIIEGHDQTRGWFYSQLVAGVVAFNRAPYDSVLTHGFALDREGRPMSKSLGNVVDPLDVVEKYGVDALRLYILRSSAPWEDLLFSEDGVKNALKTLNILWNVYYFATTYMALDGFNPRRYNINRMREKLETEDLWILSRLESLKRELDTAWSGYEIHKFARAIEHFIVEDLSRWYVKIVRDRVWVEGEVSTKLAVYATLHHVLTTLSKILAPIAPYISEEIYQNLDGHHITVHMCDWPSEEGHWLNPTLEKHMEIARRVVEATSNARQKAGVKLRWPLKRIVVKGDKDVLEAVKSLDRIIREQTNVKKIETVPAEKEWDELIVEVSPNLDAIGPVFRQWSSRIATLLKAQDPKRIKEKIAQGEYTLGIEGQRVVITPEMVTFTTRLPENVYEADFDGGKVYLDAEMTDDLVSEAYAREVIRRIQQMRKEMDLPVDSFIQTSLKVSDNLYDLLIDWGEYIAEETRSHTLEFVDTVPEEGYVVEWNIEGEDVYIGIVPVVIEEVKEEPVEVTEAGGISAMGAAGAGTGAGGASVEEMTGAAVSGAGSESATAALAGDGDEGPAGGQISSESTEKGAVADGSKKGKPKKMVRKELPPEEERKKLMEVLVQVKGIKEKKAKAILEGGFDSFSAILSAEPKDLAKVKGVNKKLAKKIISHVKEYLEGMEEEKYLCPVCGAQVEKDTEKCPRCGTVLLEPEPPEELLKGKEIHEIELKRGFTYLVTGEDGGRKKAYELLKRFTGEGSGESREKRPGDKQPPCLIITREYPEKARDKYGISDVPIMWLSDAGGKNCVRPKNLEHLNFVIEQFMNKKEGGVVVLDGIEYLVTNNTFIAVLRLIQTVKDQGAMKGAVVLIPVDPASLEEHQIKLLKKEVDETV